MRLPVNTLLTILLICSLSTAAGAAENSPVADAKTPALPQAAPLTAAVVAPKLAEPAAARFGYVDIARIGAESETGKTGMAQITDLKNKFQGQIEAKRKQLEKQQAAIEAKLKTLTPPQREAKAKEFQKKVEEFQKFGMNAEKELQSKQEEFSDKLFKAIEKASAELAKAKGLALVVIKRDMLYLGSGVDAKDVTDGIITLVDGKEPKK